ncbi:AAA family ATPase [Pedobacter sp. R20-19]|uniref:AAA family ATPase n=1 Tax=Pedobacter sp. R20-19 TaxID=1270196 RepID=UPI0004939E3A|nr:AAA family ATPase [Pedobacter sp. R20-19]
MNNFLIAIKINKVLHLEDINIEIDSKEKKHLILTGKNGSGKTTLLKAIADILHNIDQDRSLSFLNIKKNIEQMETRLNSLRGLQEYQNQILSDEQQIDRLKNQYHYHFGKIELTFTDIFSISKAINEGKFLLSFYGANRKTEVIVPKNPEKPNLTPVGIHQSKIGEFLKFLIDLKIQEALARNENSIHEADNIKHWFENFTGLLGNIFEGEKVKLEFNYKDYSFKIKQGNKVFGFNELSDGYSAIIDIIADLILKMQKQGSLVRGYEMEGIVLIDEIETHLHLKLQRLILPMLTKIFPNLQFILTTHSPFILNSIENAIAYDLEKQLRLEDLTDYSYDALAEGYFKVEGESNFLKAKIVRFKELSEKKVKDAAEQEEYNNLDKEFSEMDELLTSPNIKGQYLEIKLKEN